MAGVRYFAIGNHPLATYSSGPSQIDDGEKIFPTGIQRGELSRFENVFNDVVWLSPGQYKRIEGEIFPEEKKTPNDNVNHPSHYTSGKIEVIDFIEDQKLSFNRGNAVKYISRAGKKDQSKEVEDLKKAIWYLEREIKLVGGE